MRRASAEAAERAAAIDVELARLEAEAGEARRRLERPAPSPAGDEREALAARLERLERRREELGRVNPFAREEYERERARLEELAEGRADLERSLEGLENLRAELTETVERRFAETFDAVHGTSPRSPRRCSREVRAGFAGRHGGRGTEPGIEVELRPAGSGVTRLSLLSGGEKALGAIAFLFALFLARPVPVLPPRRGRGCARRHRTSGASSTCCGATPTARS